ncbi:MAG: CmcI family methyltransferase [Pseudomonadota bacterium]
MPACAFPVACHGELQFQPGGYIIVEDTICHHGLDVGPDPGPWEAVELFLANQCSFELDRSRESFVLTWNPKGYIRRCS